MYHEQANKLKQTHKPTHKEEEEEGSVCNYSYDEALRDFFAVVDLKPSDASGHINCGLIYLSHQNNPTSVTLSRETDNHPLIQILSLSSALPLFLPPPLPLLLSPSSSSPPLMPTHILQPPLPPFPPASPLPQ